jgi:hypothetical protein
MTALVVEQLPLSQQSRLSQQSVQSLPLPKPAPDILGNTKNSQVSWSLMPGVGGQLGGRTP